MKPEKSEEADIVDVTMPSSDKVCTLYSRIVRTDSTASEDRGRGREGEEMDKKKKGRKMKSRKKQLVLSFLNICLFVIACALPSRL